MNIQFYIEKLHDSKEFKKFIKENPKAFTCSGFFVIDKEEDEKKRDNKFHFDYYIPNKKKMFSFKLEKKVEMVPVEKFDNKKPEKISIKLDFDLEKLEEIILKRMEKEGIKNKIQKIIFSLQKLKEKDFLVGTTFITGLGMLRINLDLKTMKITLFEKKSFFDLMNIKRNKKPKKEKKN